MLLDIRLMNVPVLVDGDSLVIVSGSGRRLSRNIRLTELNSCPDAILFRYPHWQRAANRMRNRAEAAVQRHAGGDWTQKAHTLAASVRLRRRDDRRVRARRRFESYRTQTWDEAANRMWMQAHNRFRHYHRSDWHRWAITVANNHNKRQGGRYATSTYSHCD